MKFAAAISSLHLHGRAPQGARGLKFFVRHKADKLKAVAPRKGRVG